LPIGVIAPFLHLNINFNLHRSPDVLYNALIFVGSVGSYAASGWLTSAIAVICFNAFAKARGGVDASFICFWNQKQRDVEAVAVE
jgi:UDP-N-acetylmuramyl pentapeptide phosphotransferase/UDP-N-acetylglucosamine-1-phosphate transferase